MQEPILSYELSRQTPRKMTWVSAALEIEAGLVLLPATVWFIWSALTVSMGRLTVLDWLWWFGSVTVPYAVGVGLIVCALWVRDRERWGPLIAAVLVILVTLPFGWLGVKTLLAGRMNFTFRAIVIALVLAVIGFQVLLLVGLMQHFLRNLAERTSRKIAGGIGAKV